MATLSEQIIVVNTLGRNNLAEKGVTVDETATTYDIMTAIAEVTVGGGVSYTSIVYNADDTITLVDTDGTEHTMVCTYDDNVKLTSITYDEEVITLTYDGDTLIKIGDTDVNLSGVLLTTPESSGGSGNISIDSTTGIVNLSGTINSQGILTL